MKGKSKRKRRLTARNWESFWSLMEGRDYEDLSSMNVAMAQVDEELIEEMDNWCENRKGWVNDRVKYCIAVRKSENRKYRYMRKTCGVDDGRTERHKEIYMRKKEDARQEVGMALHVHNEMVMKKICEGGHKSGLYAHMKMLIQKGKEKNDSKLKLIDDDGETIDDEIMLKTMIEKFWGDLFSMNVDATHGNKKRL